MKSLFALSASAVALAGSLMAASPASAQEGESPIEFLLKFGSGAVTQDVTPGKAPGPMAKKELPRVRQQAASFLKKHGCEPGASIYFRVYKKEGLVDVLAQCDGAGKPYKLLETWHATETGGVLQKLGYKLYEGDYMVPEGMRTLTGVKDTTQWYLGIDFNYPDALDRSRPINFKIKNKKGEMVTPGRGGLTLFHGPYGSRGCVPLKITHIEIAYGITAFAAENGAPIYADIFPTKDMSPGNLKKLAALPGNARYLPFWQNLAEMDKPFQRDKIRRPITAGLNAQGLMAYHFTGDSAPFIAHRKIEPERLPVIASPTLIPETPKIPDYMVMRNREVPLANQFLKSSTAIGTITMARVKPAALDPEYKEMMFLNDEDMFARHSERTAQSFIHPDTGEIRTFRKGKGDSFAGWLPMSNTGRMLKEAIARMIYPNP